MASGCRVSSVCSHQPQIQNAAGQRWGHSGGRSHQQHGTLVPWGLCLAHTVPSPGASPPRICSAEGSQEPWGPRNPHSRHFEAPLSLEPFPSPLCTDRHHPWQVHLCPLGDTGNLGKQVVSSHVLYGETEAQQAQPHGLGDMWLTKALLGFEVRPRSGTPVTSCHMWSRMAP